MAGLENSGGTIWKAGVGQACDRPALPPAESIRVLLCLVPTPAIVLSMLRFNAVPESVRVLLLELASKSALAEFALGGGTSLALRFGHRLSVDLDFFTVLEFSPDVVLTGLELGCATMVARATNSLTVDVGGVKLDLLRHGYRLLEPAEQIDGITLVSLPDLAAMKLNALANRGSKKDFYDVVELLGHFTIQEMIGFFTTKYPDTDPFTVIRSLAWFDDAEMDPDPVSLKRMTWKVVKSKVSKIVTEL